VDILFISARRSRREETHIVTRQSIIKVWIAERLQKA